MLFRFNIVTTNYLKLKLKCSAKCCILALSSQSLLLISMNVIVFISINNSGYYSQHGGYFCYAFKLPGFWRPLHTFERIQ